MRTLTCLLACALSTAAPVLGQNTAATERPATGLCYHAKPKPACSVFLLTNAAGYVLAVANTSVYVQTHPARALVDWGVMVNVGGQDAIGVSFFGIGDFDGFTGGPAVRYRHWLQRQTSIDVTVGTAIAVTHSGTNNQIKHGSLYGLVKWNPTRWLGVAVRPELIRRTEVTTCGSFFCQIDRSDPQLSLGLEFSDVPGLVLSAPSFLAGLLAAFLAGPQG